MFNIFVFIEKKEERSIFGFKRKRREKFFILKKKISSKNNVRINITVVRINSNKYKVINILYL